MDEDGEQELDTLLCLDVSKNYIPFNGAVTTWSREGQFRMSSNLRHYDEAHRKVWKGKQRAMSAAPAEGEEATFDQFGRTLHNTANSQRYGALLKKFFGSGDLRRGYGKKPRKVRVIHLFSPVRYELKGHLAKYNPRAFRAAF